MPGLPVAVNKNLQQSNTPVPVAGTGPDGVLGGVKVDGSTIQVDPSDGVISIAGGGGGNISGSGTPGTVPIFTGAHTLGDSPISASGASGLVAAPLIVEDPTGGTQVSLSINPDFTGAQPVYDLLDLVDDDLVGPVTQLTALFIDISSGAKNTAIGISSDLPAGADNFAIDSQSPAQSAFAGPVDMPVLGLAPQATDPAGTTDGDVWYNSTSKLFKAQANSQIIVLSPGLVVLQAQDFAAVTDVEFTSWFSSAFDDYQIELVNIAFGTAGAVPQIQWSVNGGSSYDGSAIYSNQFLFLNNSTNGYQFVGSAETSVQLSASTGVGNLATLPMCSTLKLRQPQSTTAYKNLEFRSQIHGISDVTFGLSDVFGNSCYQNVAAINAFKFFSSTGTMTGSIRVYGLAK